KLYACRLVTHGDLVGRVDRLDKKRVGRKLGGGGVSAVDQYRHPRLDRSIRRHPGFPDTRPDIDVPLLWLNCEPGNRGTEAKALSAGIKPLQADICAQAPVRVERVASKHPAADTTVVPAPALYWDPIVTRDFGDLCSLVRDYVEYIPPVCARMGGRDLSHVGADAVPPGRVDLDRELFV